MNRRHKKKHHKHHRHHRSDESDEVSEQASVQVGNVVTDITDTNDMTNIYDCPKVPPIPVDRTSANTDNNDALQRQSIEEVVYDIPRSNPPRKVEKEAIYVNNGFDNSSQEYDVPRTVTAAATSPTTQVCSTTPDLYLQHNRWRKCRRFCTVAFFSQTNFSNSVDNILAHFMMIDITWFFFRLNPTTRGWTTMCPK